MTELERWMNDNPPLADALTAKETAALRQKVLARRPRLHALRGWRLVAAAAALCLVAAGAVVLGLFHPMSAANETNALVQKYGEVLDEPLTAEINGHTVSVKALLRGQNTLRVLYDVDHAQGLEPWDLVWSTANFTFIPTEDYLASRGGDTLLADIPLGRVASPEEIAEMARWCALEAPPSMTGAILDANGASYVR